MERERFETGLAENKTGMPPERSEKSVHEGPKRVVFDTAAEEKKNYPGQLKKLIRMMQHMNG